MLTLGGVLAVAISVITGLFGESFFSISCVITSGLTLLFVGRITLKAVHDSERNARTPPHNRRTLAVQVVLSLLPIVLVALILLVVGQKFPVALVFAGICAGIVISAMSALIGILIARL